MSVTYSSLFVNLELCKVETSISLSAAYLGREDATDELRARLESTQTGGSLCP